MSGPSQGALLLEAQGTLFGKLLLAVRCATHMLQHAQEGARHFLWHGRDVAAVAKIEARTSALGTQLLGAHARRGVGLAKSKVSHAVDLAQAQSTATCLS